MLYTYYEQSITENKWCRESALADNVPVRLNLFSVNIHVHQKPSSAIFREGIRLGLVYRVRVSFR